MKKWVTVILLIVLTIIVSGCQSVRAEPLAGDPAIPQLTNSTGWFVDTTGTVSTETLRALNAEAEIIDQLGFQLGGAIFTNSVSDGLVIARNFGDQNGIGDPQEDTGIAVVIFTEKEGRNGEKPAISVATGVGTQRVLDNDTLHGLIRETYSAARAEGRWEEGLVNLVRQLRQHLEGVTAMQVNETASNSAGDIFVLGTVVLILILWAGYLYWEHSQKQKKNAPPTRERPVSGSGSTSSSNDRQTSARNNRDDTDYGGSTYYGMYGFGSSNDTSPQTHSTPNHGTTYHDNDSSYGASSNDTFGGGGDFGGDGGSSD